MPPFAAIERFFERLFERPSARLFRARLQPVQLQRRIERAMESERLATADRTLVPNRFVVHLNPDDLEGFGDMTSSLASELADVSLKQADRTLSNLVVKAPASGVITDLGAEVGMNVAPGFHAGTVHIAHSKSGKPRNVVLTDEGVRFFAGLTAGRDAAELLFRASRGGPVESSRPPPPSSPACTRPPAWPSRRSRDTPR